MRLKIQNLNYLLIFLILLISFIGAAGLYSAAGGSYSPWAHKHLIRIVAFTFVTIFIAFLDIKLVYKYAYIMLLGFTALLTYLIVI